ncbi:LysR family transcriptional regulator [Labrenzia sp. PHM005]|uniref:LysR family transcriptional regulator n=1 Tax=Labrenzia sp. PHM005 TaxID=2590016 RepID=UPI0011405D03|nr:LysR family transcriptional regulator [Labrenzia sp. PHM005]QDG75803.1 LysR family transcriptional regulator [Labrenzia sp. PHM005]
MTTLSHFETFVEVAQSGSFAAAARTLALPRSTITARIKTLESALGTALFHRTTRQVRLTADGQTYLAQVQPALAALAAAGENLKSSQVPKGLVRMSVPVDLVQPLFARALSGFQEQYPEVQLDVHVSDQTVDLVRDGFDLALRGLRVTTDNAVMRKIASNRMVAVARPDVAARDGFEGLMEAGAVLDPIGALAETSAKLFGLKTRNFQLAKELLLTMDIAGLLPRAICADELACGDLVELTVDIELPEIPLFVVLPTGRHVPKRVRLFVDHLVSAFR